MWLREMLVLGACVLPSVTLAQVEVVPIPTLESARPATGPHQVYHSGWGYLRAGGVLDGRVVCVGPAGALIPQAQATVTLSQDLVVLKSSQTQADGTFSFSGLTEGVYEIASESPGCYGINSFQAVSAKGNPAPQPMHVYASNMGRNNVDDVLKSLWAPSTSDVGTRKFEEVLAPWIPSTQSPYVAIINGKVSGQVAFANPNNIPEAHVVKVFRSGRLIATAPVDNLGKFSFAANTPGPIDIVLGGSAYASMGVELVDASQMAGRVQTNVQFVSAVVAGAPASATLLVPAVGGLSTTPGAPVGPPIANGMTFPMSGGGGFYGGGSSGGGFGGGFGGMAGGLLGAAGLAVGIAALSEDDDDGFVNNLTTPVSVIR